MIYKFNNGGIVKLQNAGSVPNLTPQQQKIRDELDQILAYNREHGTNFYKMEQILEHDKQQAQQKSQNKKSFGEILAGHPESAGEAILNKAIETANNAELPETRSKIYNDTGKAQLATTAGSLLTLPMLGEFSTYGLLGGSARLAGGFGGSAVGSYTLGKAGELGDRTFGTTGMKPTGQVIGGFAGGGPGSSIAGKGAAKIAPNKIIGDFVSGSLNKSVSNTKLGISDLQRNIEAGKIGGAPATTKTLGHNSNEPVSQLKVNFPAGDITERKAPLGHVWLTGNETTQGFIGARPYHLKGKVELNKPMVQIGEAIGDGKNATRNQILDFAQKSSADGINFQGIADNTLQNQDVYAVFKDININPKLTEAEQLGIPKAMRSNPKSLEDPQYGGYRQGNDRYNASVESGNMEEAQRLRDLHFRLHAKNNVIIDESGMPVKVYHGSPENFNIFDYTRTAKYPEGHFFFGEDFDYVHSHARRRAFGKDYNVKSYYLYDTEKYPINKNKVDPKIVPIVTDRQGYPLETELYSDLASYIRTRFQNKPHIIYGYDAGRNYIPGKYDYAVPFNTQMKLTDPITYNKREIIPIVKRDNFHNPDIRYKQGGILKAQRGTGLAGLPNIKIPEDFKKKLSDGLNYKTVNISLGNPYTYIQKDGTTMTYSSDTPTTIKIPRERIKAFQRMRPPVLGQHAAIGRNGGEIA